MENKILLVDADFYKDIADELVRGAVRQLEEKILKYDRVSVPGALEIPLSNSHNISSKNRTIHIGLCRIRLCDPWGDISL